MKVTRSDEAFPRMSALQRSIETINAQLDPSKGQPVMSPVDTKLVLLDLWLALKHQVELNDILIERIQKLEEGARRRFFK